ncbi:MAG: hypothetical protein Q8M02_13145 [Candidatus Didemnitutus sp.]|nr:hypothetical protein [Candidatus Didemnitutus sp.]
MSNPAIAEGAAPATEAPPAPTAEQLNIELPKFSVAEMDALLADVPAAAPEPEPEPVQEAKPAPVETKTETELDDEAQAKEEDDQPKAIKVKPADFKEQEVLRLMKPRGGAPGLSMQQAFSKVYGEQSSPKNDAAKGETETQAAPVDELSAKQEVLAEIEKKLATAADEMDMAAIARLTREAMKAENAIAQLQQQAEAKKADVATSGEKDFRQKEQQHTVKAIEEFPSLRDKESPGRKEFDAFIKLKSEDPEYQGVFDSPRWPLIMAREFAVGKGWKANGDGTANAPARPSANQPNPTKQAVAPAVRATSVEVLEPGSANPNSTFTPTREQLTRDINNMTAKQLDEMLGKTG